MRVLVLGAGLAGLSAAERLVDSGATVTVVDSFPVPGGRVASFDVKTAVAGLEPGDVVEHGLHAWFQHYEALFGLMARAGVKKPPFAGNGIYFWDSDRGHYVIRGGPGVWLINALRLPEAMRGPRGAALAAFGRLIAHLEPALRRPEETDRETALSLLRRMGVPEPAIEHVFRRCLFSLTSLPFEELSALELLRWMSNILPDPRVRCLDGGGTAAMAAPMAEYLRARGVDFRFGVEVRRLWAEGDHVRLKLEQAPDRNRRAARARPRVSAGGAAEPGSLRRRRVHAALGTTRRGVQGLRDALVASRVGGYATSRESASAHRASVVRTADSGRRRAVHFVGRHGLRRAASDVRATPVRRDSPGGRADRERGDAPARISVSGRTLPRRARQRSRTVENACSRIWSGSIPDRFEAIPFSVGSCTLAKGSSRVDRGRGFRARRSTSGSAVSCSPETGRDNRGECAWRERCAPGSSRRWRSSPGASPRRRPGRSGRWLTACGRCSNARECENAAGAAPKVLVRPARHRVSAECNCFGWPNRAMGFTDRIHDMQRRTFLKASSALVAAGLPALDLERVAAAASLKLPGTSQPFDYAWLKGQARALAGGAYREPVKNVPKALQTLDWDQYQSIGFRGDRALWADDHLNFQVKFFHLGLYYETPVRMYEVVNGRAEEIAYDPAMFDYGKSGIVGTSLPKNMGFAGFRVNFHTDLVRDVTAFLGAAYFRAVGGELQYGLSARGLAVDCGLPKPEEFPIFTSFWLEQPKAGSNALTVYALMDSPSIAGAYRFVLKPGAGVRHGRRRRRLPAKGDPANRLRAVDEHVPVRGERQTGGR